MDWEQVEPETVILSLEATRIRVRIIYWMQAITMIGVGILLVIR